MLRRFILLIACTGAGAIIGFAGQLATGNVWWYLAVTLAVAAGWLWVGTPERCGPDHERIEQLARDKEEKP